MKTIDEKGLSDALTGEVERKDTMTRSKSSERLSRWELEELMGTRRQTYRRGSGGAFRPK